MTRLTLLHISDLHYSPKNARDSDLILEGFFKDIALMAEKYELKADAIIFSGDLVNAGGTKEKEFDLVNGALIKQLTAATSVSLDKFFIAPGNHDIDRDIVRRDSVIHSGMLNVLKSRETANSFVDDRLNDPTGGGSIYFARLDDYFRNTEDFGKSHRVRRTPFFDTYLMPIAGAGSVGIACLNTAWMATGQPDDVDKGRLIIPERAIFEAVKDIKSAEFKIAVFHHPLHYFPDFARFDCKALLQKNFDLVCSGHLHYPMPEVVQSPVGMSIASESGALYAHRTNYYNGYAFIDFDLEKRRVCFYHRRWEDSPAYYFSGATNISREDGVYCFYYRFPEDVARVSNLIDVNRALKSELMERADEHMLSSHAVTGAPRSFAKLYVDVPVGTRSQHDSMSSDGELLWIDETAILNVERPVLIYGSRESGKPTLAYKLALSVCEVETTPVRSPIFIDFAAIEITERLMFRETRSVLRYADLQAKYEQLSVDGGFLYIVDNFNPNDSDHVKIIADHVNKYPKNRFIIFADEPADIVVRKAKPDVGFDVSVFYIHPLKRAGVRELTKRWLEPAGLYSSEKFHEVLGKLQQSNLPSTGYVVSLIVWSLERESEGALNVATLLERFVEALLNRASTSDISRSALDYPIKEAFLCEIAQRLTQEDKYVIKKNELVVRAVEFISARGWEYDASNFVNGMISAGVLYESEGVVSFRFRAFREFFVAKLMIEDAEYRWKIINKDNIQKYAREIDLYTALRRKDEQALTVLLNYVDEMLERRLVIDLDGFEKIQFIIGSDGEVLKSPEALEQLKLSDDVIESALDKKDAGVLRKKSIPDGDRDRAPAKAGPSDDDLSSTIAAIQLLSRVARNSELVTNVQLKKKCVETAIAAWARLCMHVIRIVEAVSTNPTSEEVRKEFDKLPVLSKKLIEYVIKAMFPVGITENVYQTLGTDKLRVIFLDIFDEYDGGHVLEELLLATLMLDISIRAARSKTEESIERIRKFAQRANSRVINEILILKLFIIYIQPNLGDANRRRIERMYGELKAIRLGKSAGSPAYATAKGAAVKKIRAERKRKVEAALDDADSEA